MIAALKDAGEVVSEVLMTRQVHRGSFLLLEGPDDSRFWEPRVLEKHCELVIGGCKTSVVRAVQTLDRQRLRGVVGMVDDDCDRLRAVPPASTNLVSTDARDLEGVLLRGSAFFQVMAEYGDRAKVSAFEALGTTVRQALLELALPIGRLRWLAMVLGADVNFRRLRHLDFVDKQTWRLDEATLLREVAKQDKLPAQPLLQEELAKLSCDDPWQVCHGHDLVAILGIGLSTVLGHHDPGPAKIGAVLRAGLTPQEFAALQLHQDLRAWECANQPYRVLKP
jgi:hypothetical protein